MRAVRLRVTKLSFRRVYNDYRGLPCGTAKRAGRRPHRETLEMMTPPPLKKADPLARRWLAPLAGAVVVLASIYMWRMLEAQHRRQTERTVQLVPESVRTELSESMGARIRSLVRIAKRWEFRDGTPRREWELDALNYVAHQPGFQAIEWIDPSYYVRWIIPIEGNETAQDINLFQVSHEHVPSLGVSEEYSINVEKSP